MSSQPFDLPISTAQLRKCQRLAYEAIVEHFKTDDAERSVLVQLPTGTGKTGLIAIAPFGGVAARRVLVLTPNLKLAKQVADDLDLTDNPTLNCYRRFGILSKDDCDTASLHVLRLESGADAGDIDEHHLIVSNYHQLQDVERWFAGRQKAVDLIIIDEAHHQAAETYQEILKFFPEARVIGLTATPFRSDGKEVEGKFIYKYSFNEAIKDGVIRNIKVVNVTPEEVELQFADQDSKRYTLADILRLKEEAWFNRGIALSQDCSESIARRAKEKLAELRNEYPRDSHQIIAAAMSKRHAREVVKPAFEKLGLAVGLVTSSPEDVDRNDDTFKKLKQGKIDVIVHVGMLGEGFDHPPLGVAAIFRPFKSLNPYIQFLGRVVRRNGTTPHSYVVSHVGLNQLARFQEFKLFDYEDQQIFGRLFETGADGDAFVNPDDVRGGGRAPTEAPTIREVGDRLLDFESQFVGVEQVLGQYERLGEAEKAEFLQKLGIDPETVNVKVSPRNKRVKPVSQRKASRNLLNEREKSIATDILKDLRLKHTGRDFNKFFPNFAWVKRRVSKKLNEALKISGGSRKSITNAMYGEMDADGTLDRISTENLAYFREKVSGKKKR